MKTKILFASLVMCLTFVGFSFAQTTSSVADQAISPTGGMEQLDSTTELNITNNTEPEQTVSQTNNGFDEDHVQLNHGPIGKEARTGLFALAVFIPLFIGALCIASLVFWIMMLVDVIQNQEKDKALWVIIIILGNTIGALVYYFAVKKPRVTAVQLNQGSNSTPTPPTTTI